MQCPRCNSNNVSVKREYAGSTYRSNYMRTGVKSSWFIPSGVKEGSRTSRYRTIALCQNCGSSWEISSNSSTGPSLISIIVIVAIILFGYKYFIKDKNPKTKGDPTVINTDGGNATAAWADEYTSIEEFEWTVDGNEIVIGSKKSRRDKIRFSDKYTIDGVDAHIIKLDATFVLSDVKSVIVPEGVKSISNNCFNSCGIQYLYLPSTLEDFNGWNYFHDLVTIYYGGSEKQWKERFDTQDYLDGVKIEYNINPDDLK